VFYPKHYIVATFSSYEASRQASHALRSAGFPEDEVLAVSGAEMLGFLQDFKHDAGAWGWAMTEISRFFGTEAKVVDEDVRKAKEDSGFLAVHAPTEKEKTTVSGLLKPFSPSEMRWYLPSGVESLV
jgi:hypothetical protein